MGAQIRYLFKIDPDTLDEVEFVRLWREADYIIKSFKLITADPKK
ncbi:hypothetical protein ACAW74_25690 [Fibrella sp. WM1]